MVHNFFFIEILDLNAGNGEVEFNNTIVEYLDLSHLLNADHDTQLGAVLRHCIP